jgi:hypothetical protein
MERKKVDRQQIIDMIAEVLWNLDGAPEMTTEQYETEYTKDAVEQYSEYEAGRLEPWWDAKD